MTESATLIADSVFQLNLLLWACEDLPDAGDIDPILHDAGYYVSAIGRSLIVPLAPAVLDALEAETGSTDRSPSRPDLWLAHIDDETVPLLELKAHGFSPESSNARQALKMLASAADVGPSLGLAAARPGHVVYVTVAEDADDMAETLETLAGQLAAHGVPSAPSGSLGVYATDNGVGLSTTYSERLPTPMSAVVAESRIVIKSVDPMTDIRPLYFIPWLPGLEETQDADLNADGLRELTARLLTHAMAEVGRARPPTVAVLAAEGLLNAATFGVFQRWRDADRRQLELAAARILERALRPVGGHLHVDRVEIELPTDEVQQAALDRLERADPTDPSKNLAIAMNEPPTLFDDVGPDAVGT